MKLMLVVLFFMTSLLVFFYLLQTVLWSEKRVDKRMRYYLTKHHQKRLDSRRFNLLVQLRLINHKLRKSIRSKGRHGTLEQKMQAAGLPVSPEEFSVLRWFATVFCAAFLYLVSGSLLFVIIGGAVGYGVPGWWLNVKHQQRLNAFNDSLPDMLSTVIGSLRAGFSFPQALQTVIHESDEPMKGEMGHVIQEMQYGHSLEEALAGLKKRMPSEDLELMIQAIVIQRQVGGNLATVLETILQTIRDRNSVQRQIKTLTAQGRLSGIIIGLLPVALAIIIYMLEPEYIGTLFTNTLGIVMLTIGAVLAAVGFVAVRKMTRIEV